MQHLPFGVLHTMHLEGAIVISGRAMTIGICRVNVLRTINEEL